MNLVRNFAPLLVVLAMGFAVHLISKVQARREADTAIGGPPVENLVPLDAYDVDDTGYWRRLPWVSGLFGGLCSVSAALFSPEQTIYYSLGVRAATGFIIGASVFTLMAVVLARPMYRKIVAGLYRGERWIVDPPSAGRLFYYQIPCSWVRGGVHVGGVLYLGSAGLLFVPHKKNWRPGPPFSMTPIEAVKAALVGPIPLNPIQRLLVAHPRKLVEITCNGTHARFAVPNPADTIVKIVSRLDGLRGVPN
jgi:hypothetical protein